MTAALTGPAGSLALPLLRAMGNGRAAAVVASAVPDPAAPLSLGGLGATMARLGYDVSRNARGRERWRAPIDGAVVLEDGAGRLVAFAKQAGQVVRLVPADGAKVPAPVPADPAEIEAALAGAGAVVHLRAMFALPLVEFDEDLRRVLVGGFAVSLFINLIALAVPLLTMVIYDRVIGGSAPEILPGLAIGGALAIVAVFVLRRARARLLAAAHARFGHALELRLLQRLSRTPLAVGGRFQRHAVPARLREAWRAADPLSQALSTALFDAPFILLSLVAVGFVGGPLVLVPVGYLVLFLGLALLLDRRSRLSLQVAGAVMAEREAMLAELAEHAPALREAGLERAWLARFDEMSRRAALVGMAQATRAASVQAIAYVLGTGVALATLAVGVDLVLRGAMTAGGLIATMLLVWRISGPAQALFFSLGRLRQAAAQRARLEGLLQMAVEAGEPARLHPAPDGVPALRLDRVSYRHPGAAEPAVAGVSLALAPGEVVAVIGPTGAGKTTLLHLAAGLLAPQAGAVLVDGRNLAQVDPDEFRLRVGGIVPARAHRFALPDADNVALAAPWKDDTAVGDGELGMARLAARAPAIAIIDSPAAGPEFAAFLAARRGRASTLFASSDPALAHLADRVVVLNAGAAVFEGPAAANRAVQETVA